MGIASIGKIVSYARKVPVSKCAEFVASPAPFLEGQFQLAQRVFGDTCHFSQVDRSLNPDFLKGLLKVEGKTPMETLTKIKDELLKAMGFRHPEKLTLKENPDKATLPCYFFGTNGTMLITPEIYDKAGYIALIRHELEHMRQYTKLYKALGKERLAKAYFEETNRHGYKYTLDGIKQLINTEFYETMAKDVSATAAEGEKYYKALSEYTQYGPKYSDRYKYFNNTIEKEAYAIQKKVQQALGINDQVPPETFPINYKTILQLLENKGIPLEEQELLLQDLVGIAQLKGVETLENILKFIKINKKFMINGSVAPDEERFMLEICQRGLKDPTRYKNDFQQVEEWLREGKYTVEEVLGSI